MTTQNAINAGVPLGPTQGGTGQSTYATGDLLYASAANTLSKLAIGNTNYSPMVVSGIPAYKPPNLFPLSYTSGRYYLFSVLQSTAFTVGAVNANMNSSAMFLPYYVPLRGTFTGSAVRTGTALAASTVTTGIYASNASTNRPTGSPIANTTVQYATVTNTTEYLTSFSSPVTLDAGLYWIGIQTSTAVTLQLARATTVSYYNPVLCNFGMAATSASLTNDWPTCLIQTNSYSAGSLPAVGTLVETADAFATWFVWLIAQ